MEAFDKTVSNLLSKVDENEYLSTALSLFLVVYASLAAPQMPEYVLRLFDNVLVKLLMFFLIAYSAKKSPSVALIASLGLMVTLQALNRYDLSRAVTTVLNDGVVPVAEHGYVQAERAYDAAGDLIGSQNMAEDQYLPEENGGWLNRVVDEDVHMYPEEESVPEEVMAELQAETEAVVPEEMEREKGRPQKRRKRCVKKSSYRDSFYPQYVDMKPDAYESKYTGKPVNGYDAGATYASV